MIERGLLARGTAAVEQGQRRLAARCRPLVYQRKHGRVQPHAGDAGADPALRRLDRAVKVLAEDGAAFSVTTVLVRRLSDRTGLPSLSTSTPLQPAYAPPIAAGADASYVSVLPALVSAYPAAFTTPSADDQVEWAFLPGSAEVSSDPVYTPLALVRTHPTNTASGSLSVGDVVPTGNSTLLLRVLSENSLAQQVCTIRLHRLSNDTALLRLGLAAPGSGVALALS